MLFCDALDEVFDPVIREIVTEEILRFSRDFPRVRIVVTSSPIGYKGEEFRNAGFRHFVLQKLEDKQITEFLKKWYYNTYSQTNIQERDEKLLILRKAIESSLLDKGAGRKPASAHDDLHPPQEP
jgi:predicted NACHT family NTPase